MAVLTQTNKPKNFIYDRAKHHFLGNFPSVLPIEQAYVHIGMFLGWICENDLYSDFFEEEAALQILRFRRRQISCSILSAVWDGYLGSELFNEEGNDFCVFYYQSGKYKKDYEKTLAANLPSIYHVEDNWDNYEKIGKKISSRYKKWKQDRETKEAEKENNEEE
ncbi:MAG: hypothetical protein ACFB0B_07890 [Thermonemataceae bacterium]